MAEIPEGYAFKQVGEELEELFDKLLAWLAGETLDANVGRVLMNGVDVAEELSRKYARPSDGIPRSDLASDVRESLYKADKTDRVELDSTQSANEQAVALVTAFEKKATDVLTMTYYDNSDSVSEIFGEQDIMSGSAQKKSATEINLQLVCSHGVAQITYKLTKGEWTAVVDKRRFDDTATAMENGLMSFTDKSRLNAMYQYGKSRGWWS